MGNSESKRLRSSPVLQALLLADQIYTDVSGKRVICGTFTKIFSRTFPVQTSFAPFAFVLLVDVVGEVVLQLRLVSLKDNQILMESGRLKINSPDPLTPLDLVIQIPPLPLPHAGFYSFECWTDEIIIGSVRLQAVEAPNEEDSHD